jgi:hypothetical protein
MTPWTLAFVETESMGLTFFEYFLDVVFFFDLVVNFMYVYTDKNEEVVDDPKVIVKNYLKTWFIVDFLAIFPFSFILQAANGFGTGIDV